MEALIYLTGIAVILILGILATIVARKLRVSNILPLLLVGILIGNTALREVNIFQLPNTLVVGIAIFTLAIIVFDGSSKFSLKDLDVHSTKALEVMVLFIVFNLVLVTTVLNLFYYGFTGEGILLGLILAVVMAGTDPASTFTLLGDKPSRVLQFLKIEALLNTPIIVLIPFLLLDLLAELKAGTAFFTTFIDFVGPFLLQIVVGIGTGMLIGIIIFKMMRKWYSESLSPVAVLSAVLLSYIMAENLGGNGVLAVAVLGVMFGNTYVKAKGSLMEFNSLVSFSLEILVYVLIGLAVGLPSAGIFWLASLAILGVTLLSRFIALSIAHNGFKLRERLFMTLNMPKGIAIAVVALTMLVLDPNMGLLVNLMVIMTIYTLIISSVTDRFARHFLKFSLETKK